MPHFVADDVADDRGHFGNGEEFRPSRPVALARVARWIEERGDRNAGDIVDRGRGVTALSRDWQRWSRSLHASRTRTAARTGQPLANQLCDYGATGLSGCAGY